MSEVTPEGAMRVLRAEYQQAVRDMVEELTNACKGPDREISSREELHDRAHQDVDGSSWVIYTANNMQVLLASDNQDAYVEEFGTDGVCSDGAINWAALAFASMHRDVMEGLPDESELEELFADPEDDEEEDTQDVLVNVAGPPDEGTTKELTAVAGSEPIVNYHDHANTTDYHWTVPVSEADELSSKLEAGGFDAIIG